jgi:hypothetical protein
MDNNYALMDLTVYGRQEPWEEDLPPGWPQQRTITRTAGGSPDWPPASEWGADAPSPSGPGSKPDAPTTSPARPDHLRREVLLNAGRGSPVTHAETADRNWRDHGLI